MAAAHSLENSTNGGLNFFQTSELESESYPSAAQGGFTSQGISFLQESELGTSQPHEPNIDQNEQIEDLSGETTLPPIQTLTENEGPPKVSLGLGTYNGAEGPAGNAAAEQILSQTESQVEKKTDWAEEMSPSMGTVTPVPAKKKEEEEWTTQGGRHGRHQSQQRGRGGGRGGGGGYRGEGGRGGGGRGGYRGGKGGERGASNGERRGSWRGGERGRGRGGNYSTSVPTTAV